MERKELMPLGTHFFQLLGAREEVDSASLTGLIPDAESQRLPSEARSSTRSLYGSGDIEARVALDPHVPGLKAHTGTVLTMR